MKWMVDLNVGKKRERVDKRELSALRERLGCLACYDRERDLLDACLGEVCSLSRPVKEEAVVTASWRIEEVGGLFRCLLLVQRRWCVVEEREARRGTVESISTKRFGGRLTYCEAFDLRERLKKGGV